MKFICIMAQALACFTLLISCSSSGDYFGHQSTDTSERVSVSTDPGAGANEKSEDLRADDRTQETDILAGDANLDQEAVPPQMITGSFLVRVSCESDAEQNSRALTCEAIHDNGSDEPLDLNKYFLSWIISDKYGKKLSPEHYILNVMQDALGVVRVQILTNTEVQIGLEAQGHHQDSMPIAIRVDPFELPEVPESNSSDLSTQEAMIESDPEVIVEPTEETEPKAEVFTTSGKALLFEENFSGFSLLNQKWDIWGQLTFLNTQNSDFSCLIPQSISQFAGIATRQVFDFANGFIQLRVGNAFAPLDGMEQVIFGLNFGNGFDAFFFVEAGQLFARKKIAGVSTNMGSIPFNVATHKYFGIRHDSKTSIITFYTSTNGADWQLFSSFFYDGNLATTKFEIQCGAWKPVPASYSTVDDLKYFK